MKTLYIPDRGDIVWMDFSPQAGSEQAGHRPALVMSPSSYNKFGLMLACPITSVRKNRSFEVSVDSQTIKGVVLADHIKNQDWKSRKATFAGKVSKDVIEKVFNMIILLLDDD